jgi:hypothetical protein
VSVVSYLIVENDIGLEEGLVLVKNVGNMAYWYV